jgi:hypothetical protein
MVDKAGPQWTGPAGESSGAPVAVYDTEVRVAERWTVAPQLTVHVDREEPADLAELAWRSVGGAEATVVFEEGMGAFRGYRRAVDGSLQEYRGIESRGGARPGELRKVRVRTFATEEAREDGAAIGGELRLVLDDGAGPVERVTWRDRQGAFASVALRTLPAALGTVPVAVNRVVASDEYQQAGEVAGNLLSPGPAKWLARKSTATLDFMLPEPTVVTAYRLTAGNDYRDRDPRDWRLRGSMDGLAWFTLDSQVGQSFPSRLQERGYDVANSTAYARYRLDISRNWGGLPETQLNRVELLTTDEPGVIGAVVPVSRVLASYEAAGFGEVAENVLRSDAGKWLGWPRPAWLEFHLPQPTAVTAYTLTSANDHCARDPKDWSLQGSLDGDTWVTLDRRTGETFSERFLVREFTVDNATPYPHYRLHVTDNDGDVHDVQLNRVQLLVKNDDRVFAGGDFVGVLRRSDGPAVSYRGKGVAGTTERRGPSMGDGKATMVPRTAERLDHLEPPRPEMVEPFGGGKGFRFKIRNVRIDGLGDAIRVRGGGSHEVSFEVLHDCPECGNAINQVIVGLAGEERAQASVWNGKQRSGGPVRVVNRGSDVAALAEDNPGPAEWVNVSCQIVVPDTPGTYSIRARYAQAYQGRVMTAEGRAMPQPEYQEVLGWWKVDRPEGPGPESAIGTIVVVGG